MDNDIQYSEPNVIKTTISYVPYICYSLVLIIFSILILCIAFKCFRDLCCYCICSCCCSCCANGQVEAPVDNESYEVPEEEEETIPTYQNPQAIPQTLLSPPAPPPPPPLPPPPIAQHHTPRAPPLRPLPRLHINRRAPINTSPNYAPPAAKAIARTAKIIGNILTAERGKRKR